MCGNYARTTCHVSLIKLLHNNRRYKMEANDSLLRQCVKLNNSPVTQFTRTANLVTNDDIDPDDNFYNGLNVDSAYYTEDEFNDKIVSKLQAASTFSIIHFNARSMSANFNKLKSVLSSIDFTFDVIAVTETWLRDDRFFSHG